jgi:hypothetical protein
MANSAAQDRENALTLLRAALGDFDTKKPLNKILPHLPDFGKFEWMLTIIALEIELRVDIPEALSDRLSLSADRFCARVSALPKVDSPAYTLECLGLVAQALLSLELAPEPLEKGKRKATLRKSSVQRRKNPQKNDSHTKSAKRASSRV